MKRFFVFAVMLALLSAPALAGKNSQTVNIPMTMKAGSAELAAGNYNVTWTGAGPSVLITFTRNNKMVVTLPGKLIEQSNKNEGLSTDSQGGVDVLQAIRTKNMTLVLDSSGPSEK